MNPVSALDTDLETKLIIGSLALDSNDDLAALAAARLGAHDLAVADCATFVRQFRLLMGEPRPQAP